MCVTSTMTLSESTIFKKLKAALRNPSDKIFYDYKYCRNGDPDKNHKEFTDVFVISKNFVLLISDKTLITEVSPADLLDLVINKDPNNEDPLYRSRHLAEVTKAIMDLELKWRRIVNKKHLIKSLNQNTGALRTWFDIFDKKAALYPKRNKEDPIIDADFLAVVGVHKKTPVYLINTIGGIFGLAGAYFELLKAYDYLTNGDRFFDFFGSAPSLELKYPEIGGLTYRSKKPDNFSGYSLTPPPPDNEQNGPEKKEVVSGQSWCLYFEDLIKNSSINKGPVSQCAIDLEIFYALLNTVGSVDKLVEYLSFKYTLIEKCLRVDADLVINGEDTLFEQFKLGSCGIMKLSDEQLRGSTIALETTNVTEIFLPESEYQNKLEFLTALGQSAALGKLFCHACQQHEFLIATPLLDDLDYRESLDRGPGGIFTQHSLHSSVFKSNKYFLLCEKCVAGWLSPYESFWNNHKEVHTTGFLMFENKPLLESVLLLNAAKYLQYFLYVQEDAEVHPFLKECGSHFLKKIYAAMRDPKKLISLKTLYYDNTAFTKQLAKKFLVEPRFNKTIPLDKVLFSQIYIEPIFNGKAFLIVSHYQQAAFGVVVEGAIPSAVWAKTNARKNLKIIFNELVESNLRAFYL